MAYADYDYYKATYKGTCIPSSLVFDSLEIKAEAYINKITFGRITEATDAVKNAVCAVCDIYNSIAGREGIKSENNDGYGVTYVDESVTQKQLFEAAKLFLPSELLYRGL